jgi:tape measure domain-containing protein
MTTPGITFRIAADVAAAKSGIEQVNSSIAGMQRTAEQASDGVSRLSVSMSRVGHYGAALFLAVPALQAMAQQAVASADAIVTMRNRLELATGSATAAARAFDQLYNVAQQSRTSFTELGGVYATMARAGVQNIAVVQAIGNAMAIGGGSAESMRAALVQLGQGMASGVLRGEELNSVMEQAPRLAQALADGLGVPIGQLRRLGEQGELTSEKVVSALMTSAPRLAAEMEKSQATVSQGFTVLGNATTRFVGDLDAATGSSKALAGGLTWLAEVIGTVGKTIREHETAFGILVGGLAGTAAVGGVLALKAGLVALGPVLVGAAAALGPVGLAIAGAAAAIGAATAAWLAWRKSTGGMAKELARLEGPASIYDSAEDRDPAARAAKANALRLRLALKSGEGVDTSAEDARLARSAEAFNAREKAAARVLEIQRQLSGEDEKYTKLVRELAALLQAGAISQQEYAEMTRRAWQQTKAAGDATKARVEADKAAAERIKDQLAAEKEHLQWRDEYYAQQLKRQKFDEEQYLAAEAAADRQVQAMRGAISAVQRQTAALKMNNTEREIAVALWALEEKGVKAGTAAYEEYAEQLRAAIVDREAVRESIEQTQAIEREWKRVTDQIEQSLTDALMRGFEGGRGFVDSFVNSIKSALKTLVLQPVVRAVVAPAAGAFGTMLGGPAMAGGAGGAAGAGGGLGTLGQMSGMISTLSSLSSIFAAGTTTTLAGGLSSAGAMMSAGQVGSGLAMGLGTLAPYLAAAAALYAVYKKFDRSGTPHRGSAVGVDAMGGSSTLWGDGSQILNNYQAETDTALKALGGASTGALNRLSQAFGGAGGFSGVLKFAADGNDPSIGSLGLSRNGRMFSQFGITSDYNKYSSDPTAAWEAYTKDVAAATRAAVDQVGLPQWAREQFAKLGDGATIEQFAALVDSITHIQASLRTLQTGFVNVGGVLGRVAGLGGDAAKQLVDFAGGLEALAQNSTGYLQNYYGRDEIAALKARELQGVLGGIGITSDFTGSDARAQFRALVEGSDVGTEAGRRRLATLLGVQGDFAQVADYLGETGGSLSGVAGQAPALGTLAPLFAASSAPQVQATNDVRDAVNVVAERVSNLIEVVRDGRSTTMPVQSPGGAEVTLPGWFGWGG